MATPGIFLTLGGNVAPLMLYDSITGPIAVGTSNTLLWTNTIPSFNVGAPPVFHWNPGVVFQNTATSAITVNFTVSLDGGAFSTMATRILGASGAAYSIAPFHYSFFVTSLDTSKVHTYQWGASASATGVNMVGGSGGFYFALYGGVL